jgi:hypothetical protein
MVAVSVLLKNKHLREVQKNNKVHYVVASVFQSIDFSEIKMENKGVIQKKQVLFYCLFLSFERE